MNGTPGEEENGEEENGEEEKRSEEVGGWGEDEASKEEEDAEEALKEEEDAEGGD